MVANAGKGRSTERLRLAGRIRRPTQDEIRSLGRLEYIALTDQEVEDLEGILDEWLETVDRLDEIPVHPLGVKYKNRDKGYRPSAEEDPYNVFIRKCEVKGAPSGKLAGKRVGVKDNIRVAGIPMTNGSRLLQGYVPDFDAVVVERVLDAGAVIIGKLNMDEFSSSATGETSCYGTPRNPFNPDYSCGGSSSGCGAAVAAGLVDIALGGDQGGSGRQPAAWCGVTSIKPTHGLVPSFGMTNVDHSLDAVCPIARNVEDVALTLEVIAGEDFRDPLWVRGLIRAEEYTKALAKDVSGIKLGVIKESMEWNVSEDDVNDSVRDAVQKLEHMGASVEEVSAPFWKDAWAIWHGFYVHSLSAMIESDMEGYWRGGWCDVSWQDAFGKARRSGIDFPPMLKIFTVFGQYLRRNFCSTYFSKAQNLRVELGQKIDKLLEEFDVLVTPTNPMKALRLLEEPFTSLAQIARRTGCTLQNTAPTTATGHPSLTVPCGIGENNLPIGLQLIGKRFGESLLFRVGYTLEQSQKL